MFLCEGFYVGEARDGDGEIFSFYLLTCSGYETLFPAYLAEICTPNQAGLTPGHSFLMGGTCVTSGCRGSYRGIVIFFRLVEALLMDLGTPRCIFECRDFGVGFGLYTWLRRVLSSSGRVGVLGFLLGEKVCCSLFEWRGGVVTFVVVGGGL